VSKPKWEAKKGQNFQNKIGDASLTVIGRLNQFFQFLVEKSIFLNLNGLVKFSGYLSAVVTQLVI